MTLNAGDPTSLSRGSDHESQKENDGANVLEGASGLGDLYLFQKKTSVQKLIVLQHHRPLRMLATLTTAAPTFKTLNLMR